MNSSLADPSDPCLLERSYIKRTSKVLRRFYGKDATEVIMYYIEEEPLKTERDLWSRLTELLGSSAYLVKLTVNKEKSRLYK